MILTSMSDWLTSAASAAKALPGLHVQAHTLSVATDLTRATSAPISSTMIAPVVRDWRVEQNTATSNWSQPPVTRARVFAQRLADVRPVCVVGARDDAQNCLLDLPPNVRVDVDASRLLLAGCEASLGPEMRNTLSRERRNSATLEREFSTARAAESRGQYSVRSIEQRLTKRLNQLLPGMGRLLKDAGAYIEIPQLSVTRLVTSVPEARRHGIDIPFQQADLRLPLGAPEIQRATLGAYIRIPAPDRQLLLFVSLATPDTVEWVDQDVKTHAARHQQQLFGDIPGNFDATPLPMHAELRRPNLVRTLAKHLHDGHRRYHDFAYGATRESLAPISHSDVRQPLCAQRGQEAPPDAEHRDAPQSESTSSEMMRSRRAPEPAPAMPLTPAEAAEATQAIEPPGPLPKRRTSRSNSVSLDDMAKAVAMLEQLDRKYRQLGRPRFGK
ncbi:hypothetical protein [Pandoraea commovens]|uniref:Uncharacterized protein n=1 Tax=Pandoraea commovens TaxID=2508289 RepID=A0ABY5QF62_9BURK|nr:hypothetical protein [Pandoraea commovens]UVA79244.1 hypothetical protein NTU39_25150 [Pandoraea commovens]